MEALPRVITKLGELLVGEYNLQKGVKGEIVFLQAELESMKGTLEKVSSTPVDQLDIQDRIWAKDLRELSYDIEDSIDIFMVRGKGSGSVKLHGIRKFMDRSVGLFRKAKIRHGIATEIRDIKSRVVEVYERRFRYGVNLRVDEPATATVVDPRLFSQYTEAKELVGIDESRDELMKILIEEDGVPLQQGKTVSIVGFGGLGKTTLAKAVYEKIKGSFDFSAFVSVSQTPDLKKLFKGLLYELGERNYEEILDEGQLIDLVRQFLKMKRYLIVIDDIWDLSVWKVIRCALPDNDVGYIVITTTRNVDVAEQAGGAYNLKPLSENNSRKLLYTRVFGNEKNDNVEDTEKCPDEDLAEVSDRILKKCAGVPLAIITMASLLACKARNKMDWYEVYHSIGTGLEHNLDVENMRKILSFSYYNMPSHLRTCLLYLSMYPEDYIIPKDHLIWMWIAEGFIQCQKQGKGLFELGESYFNELINRSMIQPIYNHIHMVYACRVDDMVLDLIRSLSSEENFVKILDGKSEMSPLYKIRRLSFQGSKEDDSLTLPHESLQQVRSVIVLRSATSQIQAISSFKVLRVMELQDCNLSQGYYNLNNCLGNLFHLRYLGLCNTSIVELPEEIENLQFLQILDISKNDIPQLPTNVVQLKQLKCLVLDQSTKVPICIGSLTNLDMDTRVPNGIANLASLEELSQIGIYDSADIEVLCSLTELRVLDISCHTECMDSLEKSLVNCLCKLQKVQNLSIWVASGECKLDALVIPQHLCRLSLHGCWFSTLPDWMNPTFLMNLSSISLAVIELQEEDLKILGRMPALCHLNLKVDHENLGVVRRFIIDAGMFRCLLSCVLWGFRGPVIYTHGAMPRLTSLRFTLHVRDMAEIPGSSDAGYNLGLENLSSLQDVTVLLHCEGASNEEVEEVKMMLSHSTEIHPNHPTIDLIGYEDKDE